MRSIVGQLFHCVLNPAVVGHFGSGNNHVRPGIHFWHLPFPMFNVPVGKSEVAALVVPVRWNIPPNILLRIG